MPVLLALFACTSDRRHPCFAVIGEVHFVNIWFLEVGLVPPMAMWSSVWTEDGEESAEMDGTSMTPELLADKEVLILKVHPVTT